MRYIFFVKAPGEDYECTVHPDEPGTREKFLDAAETQSAIFPEVAITVCDRVEDKILFWKEAGVQNVRRLENPVSLSGLVG